MQLWDSLCPSVSLSVLPHEQLTTKHLWIFRNYNWIINISEQSDNNSQCFTPDRFTFAVSTSWMFLAMRTFWDTFWEEIKIPFNSNIYFQKCSALQFLKSSIPLDRTGLCYCVKGKAGQSMRVQKVEVDRFKDSRHINVVRFSALLTGRLFPSGNIPGTYFC